jgi:hypothetical protein
MVVKLVRISGDVDGGKATADHITLLPVLHSIRYLPSYELTIGEEVLKTWFKSLSLPVSLRVPFRILLGCV